MPITRYTENDASQWDDFIFNRSINGNFLQSRRFLSYHPEGRFQDFSLLYHDSKGNLRAVIPAAVRTGNGNECEFLSHPGSTYGGIVLDAKSCSAKRVQAILDDLLDYLVCEGFTAADLRFPPDFMWSRNDAALMEYLLAYNGFCERVELTTYVDFSCYKDQIVSNFSQGKRTNINNGKKQGLSWRALNSQEEARTFHTMLCENLRKYDTAPVHSFEELWRLHTEVLPERTELIGVFDGTEMIAAGWIFLFPERGVAHTQYLCASNDAEHARLSPMTFLYYSAIEYCKQAGFNYLSWGISTEDQGRVLNWGLTESKEHFGSLHGVHRSYRKDL